MAFYESVFIARQDASASQVEGLQDSLAAVIQENGGKVEKREYWGLRNIAYRMKKNRKGHYVLFNIDAPSAAIDEFDRQLRLNEDVIRHLVVRVDELDEEQSIMMQKGRDRDDRPRRGRKEGDS
ncbi:30S ribosomal protein S6 [Terasakiella sp. SH-1]|uniref:30S ribosomal protein S6 n=1 Tax=Terasakiella sp. SH-1 TaxID=2560057 RepID=UPI001073CCAD|nr:30S ribosomal protein S6 [Terasakiella sp. SH-1]